MLRILFGHQQYKDSGTEGLSSSPSTLGTFFVLLLEWFTERIVGLSN